MAGSIYKITNILNNKVYIGFTNRNPDKRRQEHFSPCQKKRNTSIYNAMFKYGINNFIFEVIYCSKDEAYCLKTMEPYFIGIYNSYSNGYNQTLGGDKLIHTTAIAAKISKSKMGHPVSLETRDKLALHNRKKWKLIFRDGKEIITINLRQYCKDNNLNYKTIASHNQSTKYNLISKEII